LALQSGIEALMALGLNQLEAEVYTFLLTHEPMTGYRVGQQIGKQTANVYKAIETLARRGAVLIEDGDENRLVAAVPADEFLRCLSETYLESTRHAADQLASLRPPVTGDRIYQISAPSLVIERARSMLDRAERIAVIDVFPNVYPHLTAHVIGAAARGVDVYGQLYADAETGDASVIVSPIGNQVLTEWASEQCNIVIDGREVLLALLTSDLDHVVQAVWSESRYMACMVHAGQMREYTINRLMAVQNDPDALSQMRDILAHQSFFHNTAVPGLHELQQRFRPDSA
jgi:HTH-type transcriptional regulator, sugar sensing transcriptional regulator